MLKDKFVIVFFIIALVSGFFWNQKIFSQPIGSDQSSYDSVAVDVLQKGILTFQGKEATSLEPVYPLFLAGIYRVFGRNFNAVRVVQIFIFAFTVVIIYLLTRGLFGQRTALLAGSITALFYGLATSAGYLGTETLFAFLIVFFVYILYAAYWSDKFFLYTLGGFILGLATLTRGIAQFLFIPIVFGFFTIYKNSWRAALKISFIFLLAFFLILTPWFLRSQYGGINTAIAPRGGEILFNRTLVAEKLYDNYFQHFIGYLLGYYFVQKFDSSISSSTFRDDLEANSRVQGLLKEGRGVNEIDEILLKETKAKILASPQKYLYLSILNFISFNSPIIPRGSLWGNTLTIHPMFAEERHPEIPEIFKVGIILGLRFIWFAFLFFVIYGIIKSRHEWTKIGWIFLVIIYFNLFYSAVHAIPRYALPIYPFYVILAVVGASFLWEKMKNPKGHSLPA